MVRVHGHVSGRTLARLHATREHGGMRGVGSGTWAFAAVLVLATFTLDPTLAIFLGGIAIVFHLARTLLAVRPASRARLGANLWRLAVYGVVFALSLGTYTANTDMVRNSADGIIAALSRHHATHGQYPERLSDLVPGELPEIPSAAPLLIADRWFRYRRSAQGFELSYVSGFLVDRIYGLQTGTWSVRD